MGDSNFHLQLSALITKLGPHELEEHKNLLTEGFLKRWLRGRNYNANHAARGILKTLKWREENGIDTILTETFEDVFNPYDYKLESHDYAGRPVVIISVTDEFLSISEKEIKNRLKTNIRNKDRSTRFIFQQAEILQDAVRLTIENDAVLIFNMKGIEIKNYVKHVRSLIPMMIELMETCELHYPSILHSIYIINGPKKSLKLLLGLISPSMSSEARSRIHIYGRKKEKWGRALLEFIPSTDLSIQYGGSKEE